MLEVHLTYDAAVTVRGAEPVTRCVLLEPKNVKAALRQMEQRRAAHGAQSYDYDVVLVAPPDR
jgi:hypothetical protein